MEKLFTSWKFYGLLTGFFIVILFFSSVLFYPLASELGFSPALGLVIEHSSFDIPLNNPSTESSLVSTQEAGFWTSFLLTSFFVFIILLVLIFVINSAKRLNLSISRQEVFFASLASYILRERKKGHSDDIISVHLQRHGFDKEDISHALILMSHHDDIADLTEFFLSYKIHGCNLDVLEKAAIIEGIDPVVVRVAKEKALS